MSKHFTNQYIEENSSLLSLTSIANSLKNLNPIDRERILLYILSLSSEGFIYRNIVNNEEWWSPKFRQFIEFQEDELASEIISWKSLLHPDDYNLVIDNFDSKINDSEEIDIFFRLRTKINDYQLCHALGRFERDDAGNGVCFGLSVQIVNTIDFNKQASAEKALMESEQRLRNVFDSNLIGIMIGKVDGTIAQANQYFCNMVGYPKEEIEGMNISEITFADDGRKLATTLEEMISGQIDDATYEKRYIKSDNSIIDTSVSIRCVRNDNGEVEYLIGFIEDLTQKKASEQKLINSEQRFYQTLQAIPDPVGITERESGKFIYVNPGFVKSTGFSEEETLNKSSKEIGIFSNPNARNIILATIEKYGYADNIELEFIQKNGEKGILLYSSTPIDVDGIECDIAVSRDITDFRARENASKELEQQLFRSQKMEAIGHLTGGIAHDFNNILTSILGYTELALDQCVDNTLTEYLEKVQYGGERARDIIRQMMTYSRAVPATPSSQPLSPLIESSLQFLRPLLPSNINLNYNENNHLPDVLIDATQFEQVFINMCLNAKDSIQGNGHIDISLARKKYTNNLCASCLAEVKGEFIVVSISDSGAGINPEILPDIFTPFYTTKEKGKGSGMGLSMVHGILHNFKGHVLIESSTHKGTTFSILLPLVENTDTLNNPEIESKAEESTVSPAKISGKKIMIVDDEPDIARFISELLEKNGFSTKYFTDSQVALLKFSANTSGIDLVIMDQTMPGLTGLELSREMLKIRADLPIIIISGYSEVQTDENAADSPITAYLRKPFNGDELIQAVKDTFSNT